MSGRTRNTLGICAAMMLLVPAIAAAKGEIIVADGDAVVTDAPDVRSEVPQSPVDVSAPDENDALRPDAGPRDAHSKRHSQSRQTGRTRRWPSLNATLITASVIAIIIVILYRSAPAT